MGECRRYPPTPFQEMRQASALDPKKVQMVVVGYVAPVILDREWCGEWNEAPSASAPAN